jgi:4'-phosphopantetheinyl transferase
MPADRPIVVVHTLDLTGPLPDLAARLPRAERQRLAYLRHGPQRRRRVATCVWVRQTLADQLDVEAHRIDIVRSCGRCGREHGRPELRDSSHRHLRFSLSHTDHCAALALAVDRRVGIDAEAVRPTRGLVSSLSDADRVRLDRGPRRVVQLVDSWVRKEAVFKVSGLGLALDPRDVTVLGDPPAPVPVLADDGSRRSCYLATMALGCGCRCAVALDGARPHVSKREGEAALSLVGGGPLRGDTT